MKNCSDSRIKVIEISEEISLKQIEFSDISIIYSIVESQKAYQGRWIPFANYTIGNEPEQLVVTTMNMADLISGHMFMIKNEDEFAGLVGLINLDKNNKKAEIGYWISSSLQEKEIAIRSVIALMDFAYDELSLHKIHIKCPVGNYTVSHIPRQIGYYFEGIDRAGELMPDNTFVDLEIYGMLKSDYDKMKWEQ